MHDLLKMSRHQIRQLAAEKIAANREAERRRAQLCKESAELYRQMSAAFGYGSDEAALACLRLSPGGFYIEQNLSLIAHQLRGLICAGYPIAEIEPNVFKIVK